MSQTQKINRINEASQKLLKDMNQTEIFELCENTEKLQWPDCNSFTEVGIIYGSCGRNLRYNRRPTPFQKDNLDCNSIDGYTIRKNSSRGPTHGPSERQFMFSKAKGHVAESEEEGLSDNSRQVASTGKLPKFIEGLRYW